MFKMASNFSPRRSAVLIRAITSYALIFLNRNFIVLAGLVLFSWGCSSHGISKLLKEGSSINVVGIKPGPVKVNSHGFMAEP